VTERGSVGVLECWVNRHEMAKQNSPGLQPWAGSGKLALKGRQNVRLRRVFWAQMVRTGPTPTTSNESRRKDDGRAIRIGRPFRAISLAARPRAEALG
jgi:hypothetical protein